MDRVLLTVTPPATVTDGFGQRINGVDAETGDQVELLEFAPSIVEHADFVAVLGERVARFASVRHASYVHLRRLDRPAGDRLQLVSDLTPGWRLSELIEESFAANIPVDITVAIAVLRQLLPAVALFGRHNRDNAIGALAPERLIVTPQARVVIAEHAFGPAIDKLNFDADKLWRDFRVSMPGSTGLPRANARADATAVGVVALTLLLGRSLELEEYPGQLEALVEDVQESRDGETAPLATSFKNWLKRALQLNASTAFQSTSESQLAFESVLASDRSYVTSSTALNNWVSKVGGAIDLKRKPAPPPPPPEPEPQAEPVVVPAPNAIMEPELAAETPAPAPATEEIEISLDEPRPEAQPHIAAHAELDVDLDVVAETVLEPEPEVLEPEPGPISPAPRPVFTRQQLEEDPIARQLLNYKPMYGAAAPPPTPHLPPEAVAEPVAEEVAKPLAEESVEPVAEEVVEPAAEEVAEPVAEAVRESGPVDPAPAITETPREPAPLRSWVPSPVDDEPRKSPPKPRLYEPPKLDPPQQHQESASAQEQLSELWRDRADLSAEASAKVEPAFGPEGGPQPQAASYEETSHEPYAPFVTSPASAPPPIEGMPDEEEKKSPLSNPIVLGLVGAVAMLLAVTGWLLTRGPGDGGLRQGQGELVVQSRPEGAQVKIDGAIKGTTPLTVRLDSGAHVLEVQAGKSEPRVIPLMITAGMQTSQYVELQGVAKTGGLEVRSDPPGARITIDGRPRGTSPTTVGDLTPGDHTVVLEAGGRKVSQTVRIQVGTTSQLMVPMRK